MVIILRQEGFTLEQGTHILNGVVYTITETKIYKTTQHTGTTVLYPIKAGLLEEVDVIELKGLIRQVK